MVADLPAEPYLAPTMPDARVAWSPDGGRLLYKGAAPSPAEVGQLMLLDLAQPAMPRPMAAGPIGNAAWHPSGRFFVYTGPRWDRRLGLLTTIYQMAPENGRPRDLLPPGVADPVSGFMIQRWLDDRLLAFDENAGTALRRLLLLDVDRQTLPQIPPLGATFFRWDPAGNRLAGQYYILPWQPLFWLWDRREGRYLPEPALPEGAPPDASQFFEAWSPDGRAALFTRWDGLAYTPEARPGLYRFDLASGAVSKVADDAALAAWSGDWIAYVTLGPRLTLTVARAPEHQVIWTDDLGPRPGEGGEFLWAYWPRFAGGYLAYRTADAEWRVSPADRKEIRTIYRGEPADLTWAPDGRHIALVHTNATARLVVVKNPIWTA